jgi:hypothetical protein
VSDQLILNIYAFSIFIVFFRQIIADATLWFKNQKALNKFSWLGRTRVDRRQLRHELKNKAVFRR